MDTDNHTRQTSPNHHNVVEDCNRRSCKIAGTQVCQRDMLYRDTEPGCLLEESEPGWPMVM